jgi:hypothetical protein
MPDELFFTRFLPKEKAGVATSFSLVLQGLL